MIEILRQVIVGVSAAAIFSAVLLTLVRDSALQEIVRLATGMLMIIALLTPISKLPRLSLPNIFTPSSANLQAQQQALVQENQALAQTSFRGAISRYLTEKAQEYGIHCAIDTMLAQQADGTMEIDYITVRIHDLQQADKAQIETLITQSCGISIEQIVFEST